MYEKSLSMRHFRFFQNRRRQSWPLPGRPESLGMEGMNQTDSTEVNGCILDTGQEAEMEILV